MNSDNNNKNNTGGYDQDYLDLLSEFNKKRSQQNPGDAQKESSGGYDDRHQRQDYNEHNVYFSQKQPEGSGSGPDKRRYEDVYSDSAVKKANTQHRTFADTPQERRTPPKAAPYKSPDEMSDHDARHKKKKKKSPAKAVVALILALVIVFAVFGTVSALGVVSKFKKGEDIVHAETEFFEDKNVTNILLIGLDNAKGGSSRSDSIIIASVNKKTGKIVLTSVLRDTHLYIPGHQESKVNAAYAWGGANLLIQTLEGSFGIKIDGYATVDFKMFVKLVDGIGGIDVEVTEKEANYLNSGQDYKGARHPDSVESGESVHLNGYQALWYSRIRYLDSDFMRTQRQRKVISSIASKAKSQLNPAGFFGLLGTAKEVAPFIETTLTKGQVLKLASACMSCLTKSGGNVSEMIVSQKIPFDGTWYYSNKWDGSSISIDLEENKNILYSSVYEGEFVPEENS